MKKEMYYNAVLDLNVEKGLYAISVRDISTKLGISTGALYYQFKNKDDLFNSMFMFYKKQFEQFVDNGSNDPFTFLVSYIDYYETRPEQFNFIFSSELGNFLNEASIQYSLLVHLKMLSKLGLIRGQHSHIISIVLGSIRTHLTAPEYYVKPDKELFVATLVKVIEDNT